MNVRATLVLTLIALSNARAAQEGGRFESNPLAEGLILFGAIFILAAALGMLRFPDFYTRLHATTKLVTLGGIGILGGAAMVFASVGASERVLLIAAFFLLTAPLSGYMMARSGYLAGLQPFREDTSVDEWQACGAMAPEGAETPLVTGRSPSQSDTNS
ncbi:MAG: monovalent cation/H(+) antiporter subunit G [Trueperaceae bacterium]